MSSTWFIAEGQLYFADARGTLHNVDSAFVQDAIKRSERSQQLNSWKTAAVEDDRGRMVPRSVLWGASRSTGALTHRFQHVARADDDTIYYVITIGNATGLFRYELKEQREVRLFHGAAMRCLGLTYEPSGENLILAAGNADGTASLEVVDIEGRRRGPITGGDSIDSAPSASQREPGVVLFQSCGVARNPQTSHAAAIGPATILRLEIRSAKLTTVLEHRDTDFLAPKEDRGGNLWFIRRPYERTASEVAFSAGKNALLFPWRLAKGIFGFLDTFSKIHGGEPLQPSGGPQAHNMQPNLGALWLHGRMVSLREVRYDNERGGGLVPASWELVCRNRRGEEYVAARHVVSFDVAPDDSVIYSNGFEIFRLQEGDWISLGRSHLVEAVCASVPN